MKDTLRALVRASHRTHDSLEFRRVKYLAVPAYFVVLCFTVIVNVCRLVERDMFDLFDALIGCMAALPAIALILSLTTDVNPVVLATFAVVVASVCVIAMDWYKAATLQTRVWPVTLILLNATFYIGSPRALQSTLVVSVLLWTLVRSIDSQFPFGLLTVLSPVVGHDVPSVCACADPPCSGANVLTDLAMTWMTVMSSLAFSRRFSSAQRESEQKLSAAIDLSRKVAREIAKLNLVAAAELLDQANNPALGGLISDFRLIVAHLRDVTPFLPDGLQNAPRDAQTTTRTPLIGPRAPHHRAQDGDDSWVEDLMTWRSSDASSNASNNSGSGTVFTGLRRRRLGMKCIQRAIVVWSLRSIEHITNQRSGHAAAEVADLASAALGSLFDNVQRCGGTLVHFDAVFCLASFSSCARAVAGVARGSYDASQTVQNVGSAVTFGACYTGVVGTASRRTLTVHGEPVTLARTEAQCRDRGTFAAPAAVRSLLAHSEEDAPSSIPDIMFCEHAGVFLRVTQQGSGLVGLALRDVVDDGVWMPQAPVLAVTGKHWDLAKQVQSHAALKEFNTLVISVPVGVTCDLALAVQKLAVIIDMSEDAAVGVVPVIRGLNNGVRVVTHAGPDDAIHLGDVHHSVLPAQDPELADMLSFLVGETVVAASTAETDAYVAAFDHLRNAYRSQSITAAEYDTRLMALQGQLAVLKSTGP
eukprot:TRINITY_DN3218_c0_g1_i1.p1 TRINITY_DN3218_c0_g1~~TRINITY_DN3218_c0_g1_i1.p1  ORF type:complete len:701 (+),score=136.29 TRINITY_DN3218_c0_g1_i1:73-2175(+)